MQTSDFIRHVLSVHGIAQTLPRLSADKSEEYSRIKIELIKYPLISKDLHYNSFSQSVCEHIK